MEKHAGFLLVIDASGQWALQDTCTFNNWGRMERTFATKDEAITYAWRCDTFKRGRSMTI